MLLVLFGIFGLVVVVFVYEFIEVIVIVNGVWVGCIKLFVGLFKIFDWIILG